MQNRTYHKNRYLLLVLILAHSVSVAAGEMPPGITKSSSSDGYKLEFTLPEYKLTEINEKGETYSKLEVEAYGANSEVGLPQLPQLSFNVVIPDVKSIPEITMDKNSGKSVVLSNKIYPVQQPWPKSQPLQNRPFAINKSYYASQGDTKEIVTVSEPFMIGGVPGVTITVRPFRYNPSQNKLYVTKNLSVSVILPKRFAIANLKSSSVFNDVIRTQFINGDELNQYSSTSKAGENFLIISAPAFMSSCNRLIAYHERGGMNVDIFSTSETGTTTTAIKSFIQNRYNNTVTRPAFILLIGDVADIPAWTTSTPDNPRTDLYYTTLDGTDYLPDACVGRFSATSVTELAGMINRTIYMDSLVDNLSKRATFLASTDNHAITEGTHNYVISTDMDPHGYTSAKRYTYTNSATTAQVLSDLALGQIFCVYSGHGSETSWADGPVVTQSNVRSLTSTVFPFVYSFSCLTGSYSLTSECFGETWMRAAAGASSFWGSSVTSYWTEDDILEKGIFDAIYQDEVTLNGPSFNAGKMALYTHYGNTSTVQRYFEMYNLIGDPALCLYSNWLPGVALQLQSLSVDEITGNNDSYLNPGEQISLRATLTNRGLVNAEGVSAVLSTSDSYITISDNTSAFGSVAAQGAIVQALDPIIFTISSSCPTPRTVQFRLTMTNSAGESWTSDFARTIFTSSTISGHVSAQGSDAPIAGATVYWTGTTEGSTVTDAQGAYSISTINGTYAIHAEAPLYFSSSSRSVTIPPAVSGFDFRLGRPQIALTPSQFTETIQTGMSLDRALTITNSGTEPLQYSLSVEENLTKSFPAESLYTADYFVELPKGAVDTRVGKIASKGHGGPDSYGYRWTDSDEPGGPVYQWQDISTTGTRLSLNSDDAAVAVTLGFPFEYYGNTFTSMNVCSNGFINFGTSSNSYSNVAIPSSGSPNNTIAPFWDDLNPGNGGNIYFQNLSDKAIIQFQAVAPYSGTGSYTFQVVLERQGAIYFYYRTMTGTLTSATVGIENATGTIGLGIAFNATYIHNNLAVCLRSAPDWITMNPLSGTVNSSMSSNVLVHLTAENLLAGVHTANILLSHNDPVATQPLIIPVTLTVTDQPTLQLLPAVTGVSSVAADRAAGLILEHSVAGSAAAGCAQGSRFNLHLK